MNNSLRDIVKQLKSEGKDYSDFSILLPKIKESKEKISKDDILELVTTDFRIQLHTTPNSIARLISHIVAKKNYRNAIDICCGTGNILYYLQNSVDDLTGVEIVDNVAQLTSYFIPDLKIITADSLKYEFKDKYELVVGNIPWGMKVHYDGKLISGEEAFIRKAFEISTNDADIILTVPNTVLVSPQFQQLRKEFNTYLKEIISLPIGTVRNTNIKSNLLIFSKKDTSLTTAVHLNQFDKLTEEYTKVERISLTKEKLTERWDVEYHIAKDSSFYKDLAGFQTAKLSELADIIVGRNIPTETLKDNGELLYLKPIHIQAGQLILDRSLKYINKDSLTDNDTKRIVLPGDIIVSTIFNDLKLYVYTTQDHPAFASNNLAIIRSSKQDYILSYLQTKEGKKVFETQAQDLKKGVVIPHLSTKDLANIQIPILPLSELNILGNTAISKADTTQLEEILNLVNEFRQQFEALSPLLSEKFTSQQLFLENRFEVIESQIKIVNKKLDKILDILIELKADFEAIKKLPRDEEEKIFKLCQKIDSKLTPISQNQSVTIDGYIDEIRQWFDFWELLDIQSKKFLPIAEYIFDELSKIEDTDYSPFVLQYCRTLENEILKKLFEAYHTEGLKDIDREVLVKDDLDNDDTKVFAKMIQKNNLRYELGKMQRILSYLKEDGKTLKKSPLLQHFRAFTIHYFNERIVETSFLSDIDKLTNDFRNKAAHPHILDEAKAIDCQKLLRKNLIIFIESFKIMNK